MSFQMRMLDSQQADFTQAMDDLLSWESVSDHQVQQTVLDILHQIKTRGDEAVIEFSNRFDHLQVNSMEQLEIGQAQLQEALDGLPEDTR